MKHGLELMKTIDKITLTLNQQQALEELKKKLVGSFDIVKMTIFGSVARGEADHESDLVVTRFFLKRTIRRRITDIVCEINLKSDTNLSTLVVDKAAWQSGLYSILQIHQEILSDGVSL